MRKTAKCHCGQLQIECRSEPRQIIMCHCELCQRRTGTSYNLGAWYDESQTTLTGQAHHYQRTGDKGFEITYSFCPVCGTNICWEAPKAFTGMRAVAVGCFAEPEFPAPTISIYGDRRHKWLTQPEGVPSHTGFMDTGLE